MIQGQNKTQRTNQRMIVLEMLLTEHVYSHLLVRDVLHKYNYLTQQEKAFIKRLYEGTLERQIELDYVIDQYSKIKTDKMKKVIRVILRMSVYQILYMDGVPDAAACNEAVKLAQKKGFASLKGFVNGVLRNIARNKGSLTYTSLSVKYSMPEWIVDLWTEQLGAERTETVLAGLLKEHPVTIRFRPVPDIPLEAAVQAVQQALAAQGGSMEQHPYLSCAYRVSGTDDISRLPYYHEGAFVVQDVSSILAVKAVGIERYVNQGAMQTNQKTVRVLDVCAAPGGKSMLAADILEQCSVQYSIVSRDLSTDKVERMLENFERCGLRHMTAEPADATVEEESLVGTADIVIADVPCSGLGVIGKKRDIKYNITQNAIEDIAVLQKRILAVAVRYLKPGGRLLFSTCTISQKENEQQFAWLRDKFNLTPLSLDDTLPACLHTETTRSGYLQLLPGVHDTDGFFMGVLCKHETSNGEQNDGERGI
ncbi:MAG: 16S rRNA (cytosine(967)-C(5))-methyltransferase RsmB [Lachnospiraceae bacterium]|nr:16S rRNA (cytosine(967)-C(5))-methyltransferase RsmB [Lachnospiraceae bacterium]